MTSFGPPSSVCRPRVLLIGPYDPHCGEYTFLAPPLGVWRLAGVLEAAGCEARVFDPNICSGTAPSGGIGGESAAPSGGIGGGNAVEAELDRVLASPWDVVGVSTTGMTLRFDLALAHQARRALPKAVMVAGGMEATFRPELTFELGPFDLVGLGEGERPLLELAERLRAGAALTGIAGTAERTPAGVARHYQSALPQAEMADAIAKTPYERMPYPAYWERLEMAYRVGALPFKADREARLAEIRSVRLITLNYCPMNCTFCSSTNFLHAAQGSIARVGRLDAEECLAMMRRIVAAQPGVRTVIFQDDIFVFTADARILPLCEAIVAAKRDGSLPADLQFISTNRIDAMTAERLAAMRRAGFRVLGFGVESFSENVLREFNKVRIYPYVEKNLALALELGVTPFLDLILTSPRSTLDDLATTVRRAYGWVLAGCEVGMYPYVIPFSGAAMADDPELAPHTVYRRQEVAGTDVAWDQPVKILPVDPEVRRAILAIEAEFEYWLTELAREVTHMPSRLRSLLWVACATPVLAAAGRRAPRRDEVVRELLDRLPGLDAAGRKAWYRRLNQQVSPLGPPRGTLRPASTRTPSGAVHVAVPA